jgi:hypothetical protein
LDYLTTHTSLSPIWCGFAPRLVNYKKGCTRLAATRDKVYQLLAHGRWFSPGTPASSNTKTGHHDIAEILLKVALNTIKSNQSFHVFRKIPSTSRFKCRRIFEYQIFNEIFQVKKDNNPFKNGLLKLP